MIGWWIVVAAQTPEERDDVTMDRKQAILATWEVGLGGLNWLQALVDAGAAAQLAFDGYPNRYVAKASDVLPLLANGPPPHRGMAVIGEDYVMPANWKGSEVFHRDHMAACPSDQVLTIDAWDQS